MKLAKAKKEPSCIHAVAVLKLGQYEVAGWKQSANSCRFMGFSSVESIRCAVNEQVVASIAEHEMIHPVDAEVRDGLDGLHLRSRSRRRRRLPGVFIGDCV